MDKKENRTFKYYFKILLFLSLSILFLGLALVFVFKSFSVDGMSSKTYKETLHTDYKIYLKDNEFYDEDFATDSAVPTSSIDYINFDYNYIFSSGQFLDFDYKYAVVGTLNIRDMDGNELLNKEYVLDDVKQARDINTNTFGISGDFDLDYDFYANILDDFSSNYAVNVVGNLEISMQLENSVNDDNQAIIKDKSIKKLGVVPITHGVAKISVADDENIGNLYNERSINNHTMFVLGVVFGLLFVVAIGVAIGLLINKNKKLTKHDRIVEKLLISYDRLIVETRSLLNFNEFHIIKLDEFKELLDVRDNLNLPITYSLIKEHEISYFYIRKDNDLYLYSVNN